MAIVIVSLNFFSEIICINEKEKHLPDVSIDKFQNAIINIAGREHDGTSWMKCLHGHTRAQVSL